MSNTQRETKPAYHHTNGDGKSGFRTAITYIGIIAVGVIVVATGVHAFTDVDVVGMIKEYFMRD